MTTLQIVWFVLIAVLWTGYLVLEGFGIGAGMVMPFVAKTDRERGQVQKTFGPVWDGNEVWLLTAGGATFAAFPQWYATMFSGMYLALFLILLCLIFRICAIEWRSKVSCPKWRARWDIAQSVSCWLVPVLLGVAFGNLVQGMNIGVTSPRDPSTVIAVSEIADPNQLDLTQQVHNFTTHGAPFGSIFLSLLTPFTILGGVMLMSVFLTQGLLWLRVRTDGDVAKRAKRMSVKLSLLSTVLVAIFALWGQFAYAEQILAWIPLVLTALLLLGAVFLNLADEQLYALLLHSVAIAGAVAWVFTAMAPNVMKSAIDPAYSVTIWNASASTATLAIMLTLAVVLVPIVLGYTIWAYSTMKLVISINDVDSNPGLPWKRIRENANFLNAE